MSEYPPTPVASLAAPAKFTVKKLFESQFFRHAAILVVLNGTARALAFLGTAYAARCLGPVKLGTSALIQATSQQVGLAYNGGFDIAAVLRIARDKERCRATTAVVTAFRLSIAVIAGLIWLICCFLFVQPDQRAAWMLGAPILVITAANITFAYQGLEKLPIQNAINAGTALIGALAYFVIFYPGIFLGADLVVTCVTGALVGGVSWYAYRSMFGSWPIAKTTWRDVVDLLGESKRYWALAVVIYFYSVFQIPLIARLVGAHEAGIFRAAALLAGGLELLFTSINAVLLPRLVVWSKLGMHAMWRQQRKLLGIYSLIGIPLAGILFFSAPIVYRLMLGQQFTEGVHIFQILIVGRVAVFLGQIYAWGLAALGKDKQFLWVVTVGAVFSLTLNLVLIPRYGTLGAACVSVMTEILIHAYCFWSVRSLTLIRRSI